MRVLALLTGLFLSGGAYGQDVPGLSGGLDAEAAGGVITEERGILQTQITCPERVGDAWGSVGERSWNIFEIGLQISTEGLQDPKPQLYTRYTCESPFDQPRKAGNFER